MSIVCKAAAGLAALAAALPALAIQYQTSYTVTPAEGMPQITNLMLAESASADLSGTSLTWAFQTAAYPFVTTITNPFLTDAPTVASLAIGLVQDLPNDAPGQEHIVLFMDPTAAARIQHIAWGTVFTTTLEDQLIQSVHDATSGLPFEDPTLQAGLNAVFDFVGNAATHAQVGPSGTSGSAWFATGGAFSVVAWSDAQTIASGVSEIATVSAVPEPETYALMAGGLGIVAWVARRRVNN
jgi:hypothetical protein